MLLLFLSLVASSAANMILLTPQNLDQTLKANSLVMINFSAGWCRYSQALKPVYEKAAEELSSLQGVALGYADCVAYQDICQKYRVSKYPTMKFVRSGELLKSEYRGQRSTEAIVAHVKGMMQDPVTQLHGPEQLVTVKEENKKQKFVLGHFQTTDSLNYNVFKGSASIMSGQCKFYAFTGADFKAETNGDGTVEIVNPVEGTTKFEGKVTDQVALSQWVKANCVPVVREITFENGEELTEEGLPFVILFHDPEDANSVETFTKQVLEQCGDKRDGVNFLHADGFKFAHPLSHLGKSTSDLPVLAIDSFKHMYLFPKFHNVHKPGRLRRFVEDLHSGRLHREFHGERFNDRDGEDDENYPPADPREKREAGEKGTNPPESVFKKLEPNKNRYSLIDKDEL